MPDTMLHSMRIVCRSTGERGTGSCARAVLPPPLPHRFIHLTHSRWHLPQAMQTKGRHQRELDQRGSSRRKTGKRVIINIVRPHPSVQ
jgi:hypothetical protein